MERAGCIKKNRYPQFHVRCVFIKRVIYPLKCIFFVLNLIKKKKKIKKSGLNKGNLKNLKIL